MHKNKNFKDKFLLIYLFVLIRRGQDAYYIDYIIKTDS